MEFFPKHLPHLLHKVCEHTHNITTQCFPKHLPRHSHKVCRHTYHHHCWVFPQTPASLFTQSLWTHTSSQCFLKHLPHHSHKVCGYTHTSSSLSASPNTCLTACTKSMNTQNPSSLRTSPNTCLTVHTKSTDTHSIITELILTACTKQNGAGVGGRCRGGGRETKGKETGILPRQQEREHAWAGEVGGGQQEKKHAWAGA